MAVPLLGYVLGTINAGRREEGRRTTHEAGSDQHTVKPVDPGALMKPLGCLSISTHRGVE